MLKQFDCDICGKPVSEIGSFVKLSGVKRAHFACFTEQIVGRAIEDYKTEEILRQAQLLKASAERRAQQAHEVFDRLARCHRCGVKVTTDPENVNRAKPCGEVRMLSGSTPGVCAQCVSEEARARQGARGAMPAALAPTPQTQPKQEEKKDEPKDRFSLIDME